jgi:hypothetical protein
MLQRGAISILLLHMISRLIRDYGNPARQLQQRHKPSGQTAAGCPLRITLTTPGPPDASTVLASVKAKPPSAVAFGQPVCRACPAAWG